MPWIQHETHGLHWKRHADTVFKRQLIVPASVHCDGNQPVPLGVNRELDRLLPAIGRLPDAAKERPCLPHRRLELDTVESSGQSRVGNADHQCDQCHDDQQLDQGDAA